jgi:hypothetical protein
MTTPVITSTASNYARGVNKTICIVPETSYGIAPAGGAGVGQLLRRVTGMFNLNTNLIASQEITPSQQTEDARQGPRSVVGTFSGQLSPATYTLFWEALARNNFAAGVTTGSLSDAVLTLNNLTGALELMSPSTNWLTLGFRLGDIVRMTITGTGVGDSLVNLRVVYFTGNNTIAFVAVQGVTPFASTTTDTVAVAGKKLIVPPSGAIVPSFTFEEYYGDIEQSDLSSGCRLTQCSFNFPASGFATFQASFTGRNQVTAQGAGVQVYTGAAAVSTTTAMTAVSGNVIYKGQEVAYISSANLQIASAAQADPMVGSQFAPDVFLGELTSQGSFSCLMAPDSMTSDFLNEAEVDLSFCLTTSPSDAADFFQIYLPRVKLASNTKTDSDRAISRSFNFRGLRNRTNTQADLSTFIIQDSLA